MSSVHAHKLWRRSCCKLDYKLFVIFWAQLLIGKNESLIVPVPNEFSCAPRKCRIIAASNQKIVACTLCINYFVNRDETELIVDVFEYSFGFHMRRTFSLYFPFAFWVRAVKNFPSESLSKSVNIRSACSGHKNSLVVAFWSQVTLLYFRTSICIALPTLSFLCRLSLTGRSCNNKCSQIQRKRVNI